MRAPVDDRRVRAFLDEFGRRCRGHGTLYLVGGATAVLRGFRESTADVDFVLDPEPAGAFEAIARLKDELDVSVEISSPAHFVPELADWRDRSSYVGRFGAIEVFHYDYRAQALAKLARGFARDFADVHSMLAAGDVTVASLRTAYDDVRDKLIRYPRVDAEELRRRIDALEPGGEAT